MSRKDVSLVSTFIGAIPWVTIRIQIKSGLGKRSLERSITIQATCHGQLRQGDRISRRQKNRTETKANRSTNRALKSDCRLHPEFGPCPLSDARHQPLAMLETRTFQLTAGR